MVTELVVAQVLVVVMGILIQETVAQETVEVQTQVKGEVVLMVLAVMELVVEAELLQVTEMEQ